MTKKGSLKDVVDRLWPKTKEELEKIIANAKKGLAKGEVYLKNVSEKGIEKTKKLSLSIKREKIYYDLGKTISSIVSTKWKTNNKMSALLKQVKDLDKQIKKIK